MRPYVKLLDYYVASQNITDLNPADYHILWRSLLEIQFAIQHSDQVFSKLPLFGRPFVERFALCYRTVVCLMSCLSVCNVGIYCGHTA